ncbi:MAG: hypothetical protein QOI66_5058 [Myxococcales bacterium]|nr:hypothetical protein [Myxococcales bacterium]
MSLSRKSMPSLSDLPPESRRRFLKQLGLALFAPGIPAALRYGVNDLLLGTAHAASAEANPPTYFYEHNSRDQNYWIQVAVAPGLATDQNLIRGETGTKVALFFQSNELIKTSNGVYLTPQSKVLEPHIDNIAFLPLNELTPGAIHYHQAANRTRSPGATTSPGPGQQPMWTRDPTKQFPTGVEKMQSAFPTPASLHNYLQQQITPGLRNGVAFKGITRDKHTCFHYGAGLQSSELDRMYSVDQVYKAFPESVDGMALPQVLPTADEAELFARILKRVDPTFLQRRRLPKSAVDDHGAEVTSAQKLLFDPNAGSVVGGKVTIPLTPEEIAYWKEGVPEQNPNGTTNWPGIKQDADSLTAVKFQPWQAWGIGYKLLTSGLTRSAAGEIEFIDQHETRPKANVDCYALMLAPCLARMIEKVKAAGIWDRTLIAMYTCDGSRSPAANSNGDQGENWVILAGGKVKGGYYGDIRVASTSAGGHTFSYHVPSLTTGVPDPTGVTNNDHRIPGEVIWKTVAKLMGASDSVLNQVPGMGTTPTLDFLIKT